MVKWCIWCQTPKAAIRDKFYWIHVQCFTEIINMRENLEVVRKIIEGKRSGTVDEFLKEVKKFDDVWRKKFKEMNLI